MPRLNLRSVPLPTYPDEGALCATAKAAGYSVRFNNAARCARRPHVELFSHRDRDTPMARFKHSRDALAWLAAHREVA